MRSVAPSKARSASRRSAASGAIFRARSSMLSPRLREIGGGLLGRLLARREIGHLRPGVELVEQRLDPRRVVGLAGRRELGVEHRDALVGRQRDRLLQGVAQRRAVARRFDRALGARDPLAVAAEVAIAVAVLAVEVGLRRAPRTSARSSSPGRASATSVRARRAPCRAARSCGARRSACAAWRAATSPPVASFSSSCSRAARCASTAPPRIASSCPSYFFMPFAMPRTRP